MSSINTNDFFRMNFILQDNAGSTTVNYLSRIIEYVLFDSKEALDIVGIQKLILSKFELEFSYNEINDALNRTIRRSSNIIKDDQKRFSLSHQCASRMANSTSLETELRLYVKKAKIELNIPIDANDLYDLITRYLYFCFNANKEMLLSLISGDQIINNTMDFEANNDEKMAINSFLSWDNKEKDSLIYKVVSYCYVYCCLNTKKDILLNKHVFKSKRFYLDANIIFRLAGINNDDRQRTLLSFQNKCKELGIKLCYTDITYNELLNVIDSHIKWIRKITRGSKPIDIRKFGFIPHDIYNLYVEWCKNPANSHKEIIDFKSYLDSRINSTIAQMEYVKTTASSVIGNARLDSCVQSLKELKEKNAPYKTHKQDSLVADVKNVFYVDWIRNKNERKSNVFSTNEYFITADHNLLLWAQKEFYGVPITVLPSVWLTILLRFTGRSSDDYKAFCLFMNLRMHREKASFDVYSVISEISIQTDDSVLKEKIIEEIINNKEEYRSELQADDDCKSVVKKAFDTVLIENNLMKDNEYKLKIQEREKDFERENQERIQIERQLELESNIEKAAKAETFKTMKRRKTIRGIIQIAAVCITILCFIAFFAYLYNKAPICYWVENLIPDKCRPDHELEFFTAVAAIVLFVAGFPNAILIKLTSADSASNVLEKNKEKYRKILSHDNE